MNDDGGQRPEEGHDSRRWTGDPTIKTQPKKAQRVSLSEVPWPLRILLLTGVGIFLAGWCGLFYCMSEFYVASSVVPNGNYTEPMNFKGKTRFVSRIDKEISIACHVATFGGVAVVFLSIVAGNTMVSRGRSGD
ncbi:hypothetical protein [Acidisphaera sp. L21]|uniref:hypothetical protein n=1 Tax=Acidisphaera sp. L21 TaxID=1641851 RepID=UPI00131C6540|nr:hypothetical protein [Acidisphaera sp. L21]